MKNYGEYLTRKNGQFSSYPLLEKGRPNKHTFQEPTTSFLTATTLIYAIRAGITASAGTRLAL